MRRLGMIAALAVSSVSAPAGAVIGTIDPVPAATLLLPYFEADTLTTLFSINNASATPVLAHVTVWSDQSVPVLDFDVYLTGYDVQTINLRDVLWDGNLPVTASVAQDPGDLISPQGQVSGDVAFPNCGSMPYANPKISPAFRAHLKAWLQGGVSPTTGTCAGSKRGDGILRGYVTVDAVTDCNLFFPSDFANYSSFLSYANVLWGDVFYVNAAENFADGDTLVHIEAAPGGFSPGDHTFYGRYNGASAADAREALPTAMAARFVNGGAFTGGTEFIVWREGNSASSSYDCALNGPSSWYPLESTQIVIFDEQEGPVTSEDCPSGDPTCEQTVVIPNEAQRVDVATDLLAPFEFGWIYLNLQHGATAYPDNFAQMWLTPVMDASGRFSVGFQGIQLDNANAPVTNLVPVP